jgi:hypothetical protein
MIIGVFADGWVAGRARNLDPFLAMQAAKKGFRNWAIATVFGGSVAIAGFLNLFTPERALADLKAIVFGSVLFTLGYFMTGAWNRLKRQFHANIRGDSSLRAEYLRGEREDQATKASLKADADRALEEKERGRAREASESRRAEAAAEERRRERSAEAYKAPSEPQTYTYEITYQYARDRHTTMTKYINSATSDGDAIAKFNYAISHSSLERDEMPVIIEMRRR